MQNISSEMEELGAVGARCGDGHERRIRRRTHQCELRKRCVVTIMTMIATFLAHSLEANLTSVITIMTSDTNFVIDNETFVSVSTYNLGSRYFLLILTLEIPGFTRLLKGPGGVVYDTTRVTSKKTGGVE
ncbi:hypothetical protein V9T40_009901 [Parthenolecanium corni]|uniref:Uncharacterized protein n=1 Tax=Parthenolecanium corni TaxID=536013 RepID=A0AAN9TJ35_9HEMI